MEEAKTVEVKIDKTAPTVSWNIKESGAENDFSSSCGIHSKKYKSSNWFTPFYQYVWNGIKYLLSPWWPSFGDDSSNPVAELGDELELGTAVTIDYEAVDIHSGIAFEELTVNGQKVAKGDQITFDQTGEYNIKLTVIDNAGLKTTLEKSFDVYITGNLEITPGTIKMNTGEITARVTLPNGSNPKFDLSTVTLDGVKAVAKGNGSQQQASKGMFKFNREDFDWKKGEVLVELRGKVNGQLVVAKTTINVK